MMIDFVLIILIVFLGFRFTHKRLKRNHFSRKEYRVINLLWVYHLFFGVIYFIYTQNNPADSNRYWKVSKLLNTNDLISLIEQGPGSSYIYILNFIPAKLLGLSLFTGTIIYTFLGFIGIYYFFLLARRLIKFNTKIFNLPLFPLLFFLPNFHFWSVGIGKDSLSIFCLGLICYNIYKKSNYKVFLPVLLLLFIRPHIVVFIGMSFLMVYVFNSKKSLITKTFVTTLIVFSIILIMPFVLNAGKFEDSSLSYGNFSNYAERKIELLSKSHTQSSIDISSYSLPLKVFTFWYRPLFFDARNFLGLISSFENIFILILTIKILKRREVFQFYNSNEPIRFLFFFIIIGTFVFSQSLGNLGIMLRMRNMFLPGFILIVLGISSHIKEKNIKKLTCES